jgi:surface antigen
MMSSTIEAAPPAAFSPRKISLPSLGGLGRLMLAGAVALSFALAGCENTGGSPGIGPRATIGGLGGAAGGGLLAAAVGGGPTAIAAGVILGGLLGGAVGDRLDQRDRQMANQSAQRAFESAPAGQATAWRNPDSGNSGTITPTRTFQAANGNYCREFQQQITVAGETQQGFGTACRQPDGQWRIVG